MDCGKKKEIFSKEAAAISKQVIIQRGIKRDEYPQDLVAAVVFFASPDSDFITGQTLFLLQVLFLLR